MTTETIQTIYTLISHAEGKCSGCLNVTYEAGDDQIKIFCNQCGAIPDAQPAPFAMPEELMGGAVKLIRPTDLRNRIGMFMVEEYNLHIGSKVDAGKVQDMIEKFVSRELDAQPRKENP